MIFNLRKVYFYILSINIFIIYIFRGILLKNNPELFTIRTHFFIKNRNFSFENIPINLIILFVIYLYLIGFIFPKKLKYNEMQSKKILDYLFYIQNIILSIIIVKFNLKMGSHIKIEENIIFKIINFLITGIIPREMLLFFSIYNNFFHKKKYILIIFLYFIPSLLIGSKAGVLIPIMIIFYMYIGFYNKIINLKWIGVSIVTFFLYPIFTTFSWAFRGNDFSNLEFNFNFKNIVYSFSRRITGLDILNQKYENVKEINLLDISYFISNLIKGIIPGTIVSYFRNERNIIYGRFFAEIVYGQPKNFISGYEATLFGCLYYTSNQILIFIIFNIVFIFSVFFIKKIICLDKRSAFYTFFVFNFLQLVRTGNYYELLFFIRIYIVITLIEKIFKVKK